MTLFLTPKGERLLEQYNAGDLDREAISSPESRTRHGLRATILHSVDQGIDVMAVIMELVRLSKSKEARFLIQETFGQLLEQKYIEERLEDETSLDEFIEGPGTSKLPDAFKDFKQYE